MLELRRHLARAPRWLLWLLGFTALSVPYGRATITPQGGQSAASTSEDQIMDDTLNITVSPAGTAPADVDSTAAAPVATQTPAPETAAAPVAPTTLRQALTTKLSALEGMVGDDLVKDKNYLNERIGQLKAYLASAEPAVVALLDHEVTAARLLMANLWGHTIG